MFSCDLRGSVYILVFYFVVCLSRLRKVLLAIFRVFFIVRRFQVVQRAKSFSVHFSNFLVKPTWTSFTALVIAGAAIAFLLALPLILLGDAVFSIFASFVE
jgi:hypothetical protein